MGAMAAFGVLRICTELAARLGQPRLSWVLRSIWKPVLHLPAEITADELLQAIVDRQSGRGKAPELVWAEDVKQPVEVFATFCREVIENSFDRSAADFAAAFGSDVVTSRTGDVKPTPFHMTSGQQRFVAMAEELARALDPQSHGEAGDRGSERKTARGRISREDEALAAFREALFGPWRYQDEQHSFGWDPSTERLHALRAQSPTSEAPLGVKAAIWLAFESLPLFPSAATGGRLHTGGFSPTGDQFSWPIWENPISLGALRSLLLMKEVREDRIPYSLRARGVVAVFRSRRAPLGDRGYAVFRPAALVPFEPREETE